MITTCHGQHDARNLGEVCRAILLLGIILISSSAMFAQMDTATVSGVITDQSGGIVAGAEVRITNSDTNVTSTTTSNQSGVYLVTGLKPGRYRVHVAKDGFKGIDLTDLILNVQDSVSRNFTLQLGSVSESVSVEGSSLQINMQDAAVSTVVDRQFVENMPLNGRSFQNLLTLAPGVTAVPIYGGGLGTPSGYSGEITVNGQRTESNYFTVDGVSANTGAAPGFFGPGAGFAGAVPGKTALGSTQSLVSIDALQEFRSTTSTYSAEYGRTPGGQFSFTTRAGTNAWHGSAYDFLRNDAMDANNWFNNALGFPKTAERQNDFGGTLGGPIWIPGLYNGKDKTFFFFSYEGLRLFTPQPATQVSVPDASLRQNAPAALQPFLNAFPLPNGGEDGLNDGLAFYDEAVSNPSSLDSVSVRVDHSFGDKLKIFGRYADAPSETSSYIAANKTSAAINVRTLTLGTTSMITARQSNELRFNISQNNGNELRVVTNLGGAVPFDVTKLPGPNVGPFPQQGSFVSFGLFFGGQPGLTVAPRLTNAQRQYNVTDTYTWSVGRHNLKFGVDWRRVKTRITPVLLEEDGGYLSEASVLANTTDGSADAFLQSSPLEPVYTNFSTFIQDDWRTTRRLTLSVGVRWDVNPAPGTVSGLMPYTVTQITNLAATQLAPQGTPLWKTDWHGFAPRIGIAYQVRQAPGHETVVRGGFGMFYDVGNVNGSAGFGGVGFGSFQDYTGQSFPLTSAQLQLPPASLAPPYNNTVYAFDPNLRLPYTLQWNLAVEQALGGKQALTLSYVGSGGRKLLTDFEYFPGRLGNPNFSRAGGLLLTANRATSNYNALQLQYQKQLSHGLQALASYTWSHSIDDASSNFQIFELHRANSDFDVRYNFQTAVTYDVPGTYSNHAMSVILKHWGLDTRISARSGLPVDIIGATSFDPATQQLLQFHPNLVPGQPVYLYGSQYPGGWVINYKAFIKAPSGVEGNVPRNFAHYFYATQTDLALRREFPIRERLRLQFRAEAFNILNHPNFGLIHNKLSNGPKQFGYAYTTLNGQLGGLNPLYQAGGPRSIQIALKLLF